MRRVVIVCVAEKTETISETEEKLEGHCADPITWGLSPVSCHSLPVSGPDERVLKKFHQAKV